MSAGGSLAVNKASGDWSGLVVPEEDAMDDNAAFADIWGYRCSTGADSWAGYCSISAAGYIPACPVPGRAAVGPDGSTCEVGGYLDGDGYYYTRLHMDDVRANCPVACGASDAVSYPAAYVAKGRNGVQHGAVMVGGDLPDAIFTVSPVPVTIQQTGASMCA